jgi:hypothetical protein
MLLWIYWIDEDEQLHRIPMARYTRIFNRTEPIKLFAGKSIRLIEAHVQIDEHGQKQLLSATLPLYHFDGAGLWKEDQKAAEFINAAKVLSVFGQKDWEELYQAEYVEPNRWKPTRQNVEDITQALLVESAT